MMELGVCERVACYTFHVRLYNQPMRYRDLMSDDGVWEFVRE